jgi:hypothetical protein
LSPRDWSRRTWEAVNIKWLCIIKLCWCFAEPEGQFRGVAPLRQGQVPRTLVPDANNNLMRLS